MRRGARIATLPGITEAVFDRALPVDYAALREGEGYIAPVERSAEGVVVFDGSLAGHGLLREPVRVTVAAGRAVEAEDEAGRWLLDTLDSGGAEGRSMSPPSTWTGCCSRRPWSSTGGS